MKLSEQCYQQVSMKAMNTASIIQLNIFLANLVEKHNLTENDEATKQTS
jgi:hypothetical protein